MKSVSKTDLVRDLAETILKADKAPVFLTDRKKNRHVIMTVEEYKKNNQGWITDGFPEFDDLHKNVREEVLVCVYHKSEYTTYIDLGCYNHKSKSWSSHDYTSDLVVYAWKPIPKIPTFKPKRDAKNK